MSRAGKRADKAATLCFLATLRQESKPYKVFCIVEAFMQSNKKLFGCISMGSLSPNTLGTVSLRKAESLPLVAHSWSHCSTVLCLMMPHCHSNTFVSLV